jgi:hypothetical protein
LLRVPKDFFLEGAGRFFTRFAMDTARRVWTHCGPVELSNCSVRVSLSVCWIHANELPIKGNPAQGGVSLVLNE